MDLKTNKLEKWNKDSSESALKQLARIVEAQQIEKRPLIPPHARRKPVFRDHTANELTRSVIAFIETIGGQAERINNMGRQISTHGKTKWVYGTGTNGTADIASVWEGLSVKVEVKAGNDRQSEAQKAYQEKVKQAGGIYILARSFDGFIHEFFRAVEGLSNEG